MATSLLLKNPHKSVVVVLTSGLKVRCNPDELVCHHYCNDLHCPECIKRFWQWIENRSWANEMAAAGMVKGPG
jgi:hypothetical protein